MLDRSTAKAVLIIVPFVFYVGIYALGAQVTDTMVVCREGGCPASRITGTVTHVAVAAGVLAVATFGAGVAISTLISSPSLLPLRANPRMRVGLWIAGIIGTAVFLALFAATLWVLGTIPT